MFRTGSLAISLFLVLAAGAQQGFDIRISLRGCPDSTVFLARYFWDQLPLIDSARVSKNGTIRFTGKDPLEKGVYLLANQQKDQFFFQFIVDQEQKISLSADNGDIANTLKATDRQNNEFFSYVRFMTDRFRALEKTRQDARMKKDSAALASAAQVSVTALIDKYDTEFISRNQGSFVGALMNLKKERYASDVPLASNGRPDSLFQYYYYRNHFWEGVNFRDDRLVSTPFFAGKVKKYFEQLVPQQPDSLIRELDNVLSRCAPGSTLYKTLVGYFLPKYEQNKSMTFDERGQCHSFEEVFVHLADKYAVGGRMKGYYSEETEKLIADKVAILRHLLPGAAVPDLYMIDTIQGARVKKMGFDTATSSEAVTYLYNRNLPELRPLFRTLYDVKAKYTVLVFWAEDCGHCRQEVPKLHGLLQPLKDSVDVKVFAVQTKQELFKEWKHFISENKLTGFIHVFDPVHLNNLKEQFDIDATPAIYILDKDKRIKGKKLGAQQVPEIIRTLERIEQNVK